MSLKNKVVNYAFSDPTILYQNDRLNKDYNYTD